MKSKIQLINPILCSKKQLAITTISVAAIKEIPLVPMPVRSVAMLTYCGLCLVILLRLLGSDTGRKVMEFLKGTIILHMLFNRR